MSLDPLHISLKGTQLIEASAGTGKTHTIASLYLRLVLGLHGATPRRVSEILVVTFTRAATEELRGRVRSRLFEALDVLERVRTGDRDWLQAKSQQGGALDEATREMLVVIDQDDRVDEAITRLRHSTVAKPSNGNSFRTTVGANCRRCRITGGPGITVTGCWPGWRAPASGRPKRCTGW